MPAIATALLAAGGQAEPVRIMCVGDSITESSPGYRGILYESLRGDGYDVLFVGPKAGKALDGGQLDHAGCGGYSIGPGPSKADEWSNGKGNIAANIEAFLKSEPDIVLLLIGTNEFFNIGTLQPDLEPNRDGPRRLASLVDRIHELRPAVKVLVGSILPVAWSKDFAAGFNSALPGLFKGKPNTWHVDAGKLAGFAPADWSGDGLHPSESGYRKLAGVWFGALKPHLSADATLKAAYAATRAKAEQQLAEQQQQQIAEAAALSKGFRGAVTSIADFVKQKPSYAYLSWEPLAGSGASSADGWTIRALPDGGMGVVFPQSIDLSTATHLLVLIRGEEGGNSDVYIKLMCADGERMFKIEAASISREMKELLLPIAKSEGKGNLALVKQVQVQGNFNKSQKFAYTLKRLEAATIHPEPRP